MKHGKEFLAAGLAATTLGIGGLAVASHEGSHQERTVAAANPSKGFEPSNPGAPVTVEAPATTVVPFTTEVVTTVAPHKVETPAKPTTTTTEAAVEHHRTDAEVTQSLLHPEVGQKTIFAKGVFTFREGTPIRGGLAADAALTGDTTGWLLNPEIVKTDDGRTIACGVVRSNDLNNLTEEMRCASVDYLVGSDNTIGARNIVKSTISFVDKVGDVFTDDPAIPGYERTSGGGQHNQIRSFANESNDTISH